MLESVGYADVGSKRQTLAADLQQIADVAWLGCTFRQQAA
jgi:hypothetical protein